MKTDSAHLYWTEEWRRADENSVWARPESEVLDHAQGFAPGAAVLDLGAGIGRHALALARQGLSVSAIDAAPDAIAAIERVAVAEHLDLRVLLAPMTALPFEDACFDHAIAWNVIYHGDETIVRRTFAELARVLRPGGTLIATMLSARRLPVEQAKAEGHEISPNTWVFTGEGDKVHPHYFCDARGLLGLMPDFEIWSLRDQEHDKPGSWHWHFVAGRL
ncbi:MAG: hypothetical protein RIT14_2392 [Pseudomonadota bacterium]|jgi:SAM-dependent methyltransferase